MILNTWGLYGNLNKKLPLDGSYVKAIVTASAVVNGCSRPFWGFFFDNKGFKPPLITVQIAGIVISASIYFTITIPVLFSSLAIINMFFFGSHFAIFPAVCDEIFGKK